MLDLYLIIEEQEEIIKKKEDNLYYYSNFWFEKNDNKNELLLNSDKYIDKYEFDYYSDHPYPINKFNLVIMLLLKFIN